MPSSAKPGISAYSQGASCQGMGAGTDRSKARGVQNCINAQKAQIEVPWFGETRCLVSWDLWKFFWWDPSSPTPLFGISRLRDLNTLTQTSNWLNTQQGKLHGQIGQREMFLHADLRSELVTSQRTYSHEFLSSDKPVSRTV